MSQFWFWDGGGFEYLSSCNDVDDAWIGGHVFKDHLNSIVFVNLFFG